MLFFLSPSRSHAQPIWLTVIAVVKAADRENKRKREREHGGQEGHRFSNLGRPSVIPHAVVGWAKY